MSWFRRPKYTLQGEVRKKDFPDGVFIKCEQCNEMLIKGDLEKNAKICPKCNHYFKLSAGERLALVADLDSFQECDIEYHSVNALDFVEYDAKLEKGRKRTGLDEALISGLATIENIPVSLVILDFFFMGGSMGSVMGEKVTLAAERSLDKHIPLVIISAGGGGARMHEGMLSLMQMAKTSAAIGALRRAGIPYISVVTNPTMGGVAASFSSLGDVNLAEPHALLGFAGPRVIQQTIGERLPEGFQTSEFLLEHGMLDAIVSRKEMKRTIALLLRFLTNQTKPRNAKDEKTNDKEHSQ